MTLNCLKNTRLPLYGLVAVLLGGCDTAKYDDLQMAKPVPGSFSKALVQEYSQFAKSEIEQQDWPDQQYFAQKGLKIVQGDLTLPERPDDWSISSADQSDFIKPRTDLIHWLNTDGRQVTPVRAAKAQASFDCWVEQKEENWQDAHIQACKQSLTRSLPEITQINFAFDRSIISNAGAQKIEKIVRNWQKNPGNYLIVQGHAGPIGSKNYNYHLSRKRAKAVQKRLVALGIPEDTIHIQLWGKSRPRIELANSASVRSNRRVEIMKF